MKMHFGPTMKVNTEQKEVTNHLGIELYKMPPVILATGNENKTKQFVNNWYEECEKQLNTNANFEMFPAPPCILAEEEQ